MKKGFTLAEVLITLAIIGVVAALTIPSVISKAEQIQFKTGLKKAVSALNSAIQLTTQQEGVTPNEGWDLFYYLQKHMSIMTSATFFDDTARSKYRGNEYFYTTDGMRFEFNAYNAHYPFRLYGSEVSARYNNCGNNINNFQKSCACGSYGLTENPNNTLNPPCIILVDINGNKKPNPKSKDLFWANGDYFATEVQEYIYPSPTDKKLTDVFNILITEDRAIPYGVVAQRAMYSK